MLGNLDIRYINVLRRGKENLRWKMRESPFPFMRKILIKLDAEIALARKNNIRDASFLFILRKKTRTNKHFTYIIIHNT